MTLDPLMQHPNAADFDHWAQTTDEVTSILLEYPDRAGKLWLRGFPVGTCSVTSGPKRSANDASLALQ
ncbi:hypothetical protein [Glaciibacter superstes]|uniref:hypothetical protein n=1 Tax=Glaciibacter superstes TaxID=501023 RepID=UPI0012F7DD8A|nr:hypothetical protein [Glaciibacter superstes]